LKGNLRVKNSFKLLLLAFKAPPKGYSSHNKVDTILTPIKAFDKGKRIASEPSKRLEGKKCFTCHGYEHIRVDCPIGELLPLEKWKKCKLLRRQLVKSTLKEMIILWLHWM